MPLSAWLMMTFGCLILYGGLTVCLVIAIRNRPTDLVDKEKYLPGH